MADSTIDLSLLTFSAEQVRALRDLFFSKYVLGGDFAQFHTIMPGVEYDREIGIVGELGDVGIAAQGCNPTATATNLGVTKKTWQPKRIQTVKDLCFEDFLTSAGFYSLKKGVAISDLTGTDILDIYMDALQKAWNKMYWRIWLMDTDAAHSDDSPAGVITPSKALNLLTLVDGYWKQIYAIVAADANRKVAIAANAQLTYALQESTLTPALAWEYLNNVTYNAHAVLKSIPRSEVNFYATRSLVDKAKQHLQDKTIVNTYLNMVNGIETLMVNGYVCTPLDIWDEQIMAFEDNGKYYNKRHRAAMFPKNNLLMGTSSSTMMKNLDAFYDRLTKITRLEALDSIAPLIIQDNLIQVAY